MILVSAGQMQQIDKQAIETFGIPSTVLMENAGRGAVKVLLSDFGDLSEKKIAVMAGKGNNGGDGFVVARYLAERNIQVTVYLLGKATDLTGDAKLNYDLLADLSVNCIEIPDQKTLLSFKSTLANRDIFVDAILGTGLNAEVRGYYKSVIELINGVQKPVLAIDLPSGMNPDTGFPLGLSVKATATVTFGHPKTGQLMSPGTDYCGRLHVVDIGIPSHITDKVSPSVYLLSSARIKSLYKPRLQASHKGDNGHLMVLGGSTGKTGAAILAALSGLKCGTGLVTVGIPASSNRIVETALLEAMSLPLSEGREGTISNSASDVVLKHLAGKKCCVVGPGMGTNESLEDFLSTLLTNCNIPVVIDADGLNNLTKNFSLLRSMAIPPVITPHPGEMARLMDKKTAYIQENRLQCARGFAEDHRCHVVLKGVRTVIAHPDGTVYLNPTGNELLASGGTGDVLAGLIAGFIAQGYNSADACHMGTFIHGLAADDLKKEFGSQGILANSLTDRFPLILNSLATGTFQSEPAFSTVF